MADPLTDDANGAIRVEYLLGAPLAEGAVRQRPQMREIVRGRQLIADIDGHFPELTLEVGRRHQLGGTIVVEWTCNYGDGRLYRNFTIGEFECGEVVTVTDYWAHRSKPRRGDEPSPTSTTCPPTACGTQLAISTDSEREVTKCKESRREAGSQGPGGPVHGGARHRGVRSARQGRALAGH